jgi:hypothetical protein
MKRILSIFLSMILVAMAMGQSPAQINYQGIARNSVGNALVNQSISLRLTIHDGNAAGTVVYRETRAVITNYFGLFNVAIGSAGATNVTGTISAVNWASGGKFLQVEMDPASGTNFLDMGTAQLLSVPYALYSGGASPTGAAGGDLTGTYPNPGVAKIRGVNVNATAPTLNQVLLYNGTDWIASANVAANLTLPFVKTQADAGALIGITNSGAGDAIQGINTGTGRGAFFQVNNAANAAAALSATTNGTGNAGFFQNTNAANLADALNVTTNGGATSWAIRATSTGTQGAGIFNYNNAAGAANALRVLTNGSGFAANITSSNATPLALRTAGGLQFTGISEGANKILTSDASGNATWQSASGLIDKAGISLVSIAATLTVPDNTDVPITQWSVVNYEDGGSNYNPVTGEYTIPVTGVYQVAATVTWNPFSAASELTTLKLFRNGGFWFQTLENSGSGAFFGNQLTLLDSFNAGDKISIKVFQNSGSDQTVLGGSYASSFAVTLIHK